MDQQAASLQCATAADIHPIREDGEQSNFHQTVALPPSGPVRTPPSFSTHRVDLDDGSDLNKCVDLGQGDLDDRIHLDKSVDLEDFDRVDLEVRNDVDLVPSNHVDRVEIDKHVDIDKLNDRNDLENRDDLKIRDDLDDRPIVMNDGDMSNHSIVIYSDPMSDHSTDEWVDCSMDDQQISDNRSNSLSSDDIYDDSHCYLPELDSSDEVCVIERGDLHHSDHSLEVLVDVKNDREQQVCSPLPNRTYGDLDVEKKRTCILRNSGIGGQASPQRISCGTRASQDERKVVTSSPNLVDDVIETRINSGDVILPSFRVPSDVRTKFHGDNLCRSRAWDARTSCKSHACDVETSYSPSACDVRTPCRSIACDVRTSCTPSACKCCTSSAGKWCNPSACKCIPCAPSESVTSYSSSESVLYYGEQRLEGSLLDTSDSSVDSQDCSFDSLSTGARSPVEPMMSGFLPVIRDIKTLDPIESAPSSSDESESKSENEIESENEKDYELADESYNNKSGMTNCDYQTRTGSCLGRSSDGQSSVEPTFEQRFANGCCPVIRTGSSDENENENENESETGIEKTNKNVIECENDNEVKNENYEGLDNNQNGRLAASDQTASPNASLCSSSGDVAMAGWKRKEQLSTEDECIDGLFYHCDSQGTGNVRVSQLISYLRTTTGDSQHVSLRRINFSEVYISSFIKENEIC